MKREHVAIAVDSVRKSYGTNWDANLFRALDDVARELAKQIPHAARPKFLEQCGVKNHD